MSKYFTSIAMLLFAAGAISQRKPIDLQSKDTVANKQEYGLRIGVDISRPVLSFADEDYTGFEIVGDYRINESLWLAAELGNEERSRIENLSNIDIYDFTTSGSYLKLGADYNTYQNWYGMSNSITLGGRYAIASFSQTLNEYRIFDSNRYFNPDGFIVGSTEAEEFSSLNATWLELVIGLKAELFSNIYVGMSIRLGHLITNTEEDRFPNLWIPGFNKVTDNSKWGVGYNYSISYFIPFYKRAKKKRETLENQE
ncbi:MAG: DUF6048 family protein [Bacteroidota bacterium]